MKKTITQKAAAELDAWAAECSDIARAVLTDGERRTYEKKQERALSLAEELRAAPLQFEKGNDYTWVPDESGWQKIGVWITVGQSSLHLTWNAEKNEITYEVLPIGDEADGEVYDEGSIALI